VSADDLAMAGLGGEAEGCEGGGDFCGLAERFWVFTGHGGGAEFRRGHAGVEEIHAQLGRAGFGGPGEGEVL
jgi:hypothetical protein